MAPASICIRGSGVAAQCCLALLPGKGYIGGLDSDTPRLPAILLSSSTQKLLADIFRSDQLFEGLPEIRERVVAWGPGHPIRLPHSGVIVSEKVLLERLRARFNDGHSAQDEVALDPQNGAAQWTIFTASRSRGLEAETQGAGPKQMRFGSRMATIREVELAKAFQRDACWIEAVEEGWLFLLPVGEARGSLISVGPKNDRSLANSRLIAPLLQNADRVMCSDNHNRISAEVAAYPRIATSLAADGWFACGSAAMTFDPLCGEGAGNAAREAILACASIRAINAGEPARDVLAEYGIRLQLGFLRHLETCREFYTQTSSNDFWAGELRTIDEGIVWSKTLLEKGPAPKYRLVDFSLER